MRTLSLCLRDRQHRARVPLFSATVPPPPRTTFPPVQVAVAVTSVLFGGLVDVTGVPTTRVAAEAGPVAPVPTHLSVKGPHGRRCASTREGAVTVRSGRDTCGPEHARVSTGARAQNGASNGGNRRVVETDGQWKPARGFGPGQEQRDWSASGSPHRSKPMAADHIPPLLTRLVAPPDSRAPV